MKVKKMKKLMMAVAVVCAAVAANAATYDWQAAGSFYWGDDSATGEELAGATIYAFDGNIYNMNTVMASLGTGNTTVLDDAMNYGVVDMYASFDFGGSKASNGITDDGGSPDKYINAFLVAVTKDGKYATSMAYDPIKVVEAVEGSGAIMQPDWAVANLPAAGADGWTSVAPEPTSGLLLLIGVAGLALKRKRA